MKMSILLQTAPKLRSIRNFSRTPAIRSESNPRAAAPGPAAAGRIFHRSSFWFDFRNSAAAFYFHDLVAQKRCAFEFEVRRGFLHFFFQFAQQFGQVKIAAGLPNNRGGDFAPAKNGMQALLHRAPN